MKATIELSGIVELIYNPSSPEFLGALEDYKVVYDKDASADEMLKHVAFHIVKFGNGLVEGVGYVGYEDMIPESMGYSGIQVKSGYDNFEFDILSKTGND